MSDPFDPIQKPRGMYTAPPDRRITATEWIAMTLCIIWFAGAALFFLVLGGADAFDAGTGLQFLMVMLGVFLPVAMIMMVVAAARSVRLMRDESQRLQATVDHMRQSFEQDAMSRNTGLQPSIVKKLDDIAEVARNAETAVAMFTSQRSAKDAPVGYVNAFAAGDETQPALALDLADSYETTAKFEDLIKALNFPEDENDKAGFIALRRALKDRKAAMVVRAAQDILTLLSEDGIYMDDLRPDRARPDLWRRYAIGERGAMITALGGVRDRASLALTAGRMRQDEVFRDTVHHFLRRFDEMLQRIEVNMDASDAELAALTNTRSAKAFMLLGRVTGIFD
ncbi:MAG: hypothetical protein ACPG5U_02290 [Planktomarina sp.]